MRNAMRTLIGSVGLAVAVLIGGHQPGLWADDKPEAKESKPAPKKDDHEHAHGATGPHKGALIELGEEEYHGEIVVEEKSGLISIYVLDSHAKDVVPIEATEVTINLKVAGKAQQKKLKATPAKSDPKGKASCFTLKDKDLTHDLHHADKTQPQLRVKIAGKNYSGKIALDHDHDHDHGETKK